MESHHDTANPRISRSVRVGHPAPRGGHCIGPHLDGCRAHGGASAVALHDRGRAVGGRHRLADGRPVLGLGKYVGGGIFLVLWADGRLPWQFALPAGIGDVATGCFAIVVAALLAQKAPGAHTAAYAWCLFGIADLVVAVTMGAMTSPGRAHLFAFDAPNLLISSYPLVMVPTFAVPLALMLHGLVLWRLGRKTASTGPLVAA